MAFIQRMVSIFICGDQELPPQRPAKPRSVTLQLYTGQADRGLYSLIQIL